MNIKEITVTASASKNYQKFDISITADNLTDNDFDTLKSLVISKALKGIDELTGSSEGSTISVKLEEKKEYINTNTYQTPYKRNSFKTNYNTAPVAATNYNTPKMASEKQIETLKNLHYTGDLTTVTSQEASAFITATFAK